MVRPSWRRTLWLGLPAAAAVCLAALLVVDGRWFVIPDVYVAALAILGLAGASQTGWAMAAIGAALGGGLLAAVRWAAGVLNYSGSWPTASGATSGR